MAETRDLSYFVHHLDGGIARIERRVVRVVRDTEKVKEYIIPPGFVLYVKNGDTVDAGQQLTEGNLDLHQLYKLRGKDAVQKYILKDVQAIYTSQGQKLNDKHIEIIIKQMFSRVLVKDSGETDLLPGEIIEKAQFLDENIAARSRGSRQATADELFLGITKVALSTQSFLSAASFQETTRVLTQAAVEGKRDSLIGLKENVIVGRLIPAGTGAGMNRLRVAATSRDAALRAQYRKLQESLIAPQSAAEEHAAELAQGPEAAIGDDALAAVEGETHGLDADAGDYLVQDGADGE